MTTALRRVAPHEHRVFVRRAGPDDRTARAVLLALHVHADNESGHAFPSQRTISELTGYCERAVRNASKRLEQLGWIERVANDGSGRHARLTSYFLTVPRDVWLAEVCGTQSAGSSCTAAAESSGTQSAGSSGLANLREASTTGTLEHEDPASHVDHPASGSKDPAPRVPTNSSSELLENSRKNSLACARAPETARSAQGRDEIQSARSGLRGPDGHAHKNGSPKRTGVEAASAIASLLAADPGMGAEALARIARCDRADVDHYLANLSIGASAR